MKASFSVNAAGESMLRRVMESKERTTLYPISKYNDIESLKLPRKSVLFPLQKLRQGVSYVRHIDFCNQKRTINHEAKKSFTLAQALTTLSHLCIHSNLRIKCRRASPFFISSSKSVTACEIYLKLFGEGNIYTLPT